MGELSFQITNCATFKTLKQTKMLFTMITIKLAKYWQILSVQSSWSFLAVCSVSRYRQILETNKSRKRGQKGKIRVTETPFSYPDSLCFVTLPFANKDFKPDEISLFLWGSSDFFFPI